MDNLRNSDRHVDAGNGICLHHGWVYSHPTGLGGRSCGDTVDQRPSTHMRHLSKSKGAGIFQAPSRLSELSRVYLLVPVLRSRATANARSPSAVARRFRKGAAIKKSQEFCYVCSKPVENLSRALMLAFSITVLCMMLSSTA